MTKNFVSNKDLTVRMFKSNFMESLSKVHPAVPVIIYLPAILYFLFRTIFLLNLSAVNIIVLILLGIFVWSITEYTLHRFVFHFKFKSKFGERLHFIFHGVHHDYPNDSKRLVMPPSLSIPLSVIFYFLFEYVLGAKLVFPFFVGFLAGYLFYDMTHYAIHYFNIHNKSWLKLKKHHMRHHYQDPSKGFGVSNTIWDKVIGTNFDTKKS